VAGEHECAADGCIAQAKPGQLMCWPCWKRVPRALQRAVNETWRNYRRDPESYLSAKGAAIQALRDNPKPEQGSLI
jgi:hypothetical protein